MKKIEEQVISYKVSCFLQERGIKVDSIFYYQPFFLAESTIKKVAITQKKPYERKEVLSQEEKEMLPVSAYLATELGDLLPTQIPTSNPQHKIYQLFIEKTPLGWHVGYVCLDCQGLHFGVVHESLAEAMGLALLHIINEKLVIIA